MRENSIRRHLELGTPTLGTHLFLSSPVVVEIIGETGVFDYVEFLAEYSAYDLKVFEDLCRAAELHGLGTMVKVDFESHRLVAQRSVGAGFESVLFADARSAEDVEGFVRCLRPDTPEDLGLFGAAARRHALPGYGGTPRYVRALREVVVAIMVEKAGAVERLDELLAVPGVDMVQWGPADYCMSIGRPGDWASDDVRAVERRVIATCLEAGIRPRAEIDDVEQAKYYADLGVRDFCLGHDLFVLRDALKDRGERLRTAILEETDAGAPTGTRASAVTDDDDGA
jgi:2-keto-3-deoxy-L-rhamnonate aldolase RhmA